MCFFCCTSLTDITIPDSVTGIGNEAFYKCTSLTSITIPDSVISIAALVFNECTSLTSIIVANNNKNFSNDEYGVLFDKNKTRLLQYPVGNSRLSYIIPDGTTTIDGGAFEACHNLTNIMIPDSVTNIGSSAFERCTDLTSITIPDGLSLICWGTFYGCSSLTSITIPNSVKSINDYAFRDCTRLTSIVIPDSVIRIGSYSFWGCDALDDVYYTGTEEQWNAIEIEEDNDSLFNAMIHYCDHANTMTYDEEPASCTEDGYTAGVFCNDCQQWISGHKIIKKHHTDTDGDNICDICGESTVPIIRVDETLNISVNAGKITYVKFVPEVSGRYTFNSSSDQDTYGYLYDGNMDMLNSYDDSGDYNNFSLTYDLEAGKTYYWGAAFYSSDRSGN